MQAQRRGSRAGVVIRRILLAWGALAAALLLVGLWELRAGARAAGAARVRAPRSAADALAGLRAARTHFGRAAMLLRTPLLAPVRVLPWVGGDVVQAGQVAAAARRGARGGERVVRAAAAVRTRGGCVDAVALASLDRVAQGARGDARELLAALARHAAVAPVEDRLASARTEAMRVERSLGDLGDVLALARAQLTSTRRALLLVLSPSEGRGSGGVIGSYAVLTVRAGCFSLGTVGRTTELSTAAGAVPRTLTGDDAFVRRYSRFDAANTWQNLTMSPHFPSVAAAAASSWAQSGRTPVDLVVAVDPVVVEALLGVVGPVRVEGLRDPVRADDAVRLLAHDLYADVRTEADNLQRIATLGRIVDVVWARVVAGAGSVGTGGVDGLGLARALGPAVRGRHLQLWSARPDEQVLLVRLGAAGALRAVAPGDDALLVVTNNASASKIEWYLRRAVDVSVRLPDGDGAAVSSTVTVTLRNTAPADGPDYIVGNDVGLPPGTSRLYVSLYSPLDLVSVSLPATERGDERVRVEADQEDELDRYVYSVWVDVPAGASRDVRFDLRADHAQVRAAPYRLAVEEPPLLRHDDVRLRVGRAGRVLVDRSAQGALAAVAG